MKFSLIFIIMHVFVTTWAIEIRPDLKHFRQETREHRMRVLDYSTLALEQFQHLFPTLMSLPKKDRVHLVEAYFVLHDIPKMMTKEQLEKFGYHNDINILQRLHRVYGVSVRPDVVDELNHIEKVMKALIMDKKFSEMPPWIQALKVPIIEELQKLEWPIDVADTKNFRSQELGFKKEPRAAWKFLMSRGEYEAAEIASWVEETQIKDSGGRLCRHLIGIKNINF